MTGYSHSLYAESLAEFGDPRELPRCGGWILQRKIPGFSCCDAMGCYPLFVCQDWTALEADLEDLQHELVSLAMVTGPFGNYDEDCLKRCFPEVFFHYKDHFVIDLSSAAEERVSAHHRRNARRALKSLEIRLCETPSETLPTWLALYQALIERHGIKGIAAFSSKAFATQLRVPGLVVFEAVYRGHAAGMLLWYVQDSVAYYHLGAHNENGYRTRASFGLFWFAIKHFADKGLRWLDLGAGAGTAAGASGLTRFKRGWSTGTRPVYFCGRVFKPSVYEAITVSNGAPPATGYFPAYRKGEFN